MFIFLLALSVSALTWTNCGSPSDGTKILDLTVTPSPIVLGENVTIQAAAYLNETINTSDGIHVQLELYKKTLGTWIYIPCIDGIGSCEVTGICEKLADAKCPSILQQYNIPCKCPINAGSYKVGPPGISIPTKNPGTSLLDGEVKAKATVTDTAGNRLICVQAIATLSTSSDGVSVLL